MRPGARSGQGQVPLGSATFTDAGCLLYVPGSRGSKELPEPAGKRAEPSFTTCPYCLGLGEKHEGNASQPAVTCSWCGGRGFLKSVPKPDKL